MKEKEKRIVFRITESNYFQLQEAAALKQLPVSTYVRMIAIERAAQDIEGGE